MVSPEVEAVIARVAAAVGADEAGVLLNWNHTHLAPPGGRWGGSILGEPDEVQDAAVAAFAHVIQDKVVSVCRLAAERLEPARVVWGVGEADISVNRRERTADGRTILGWNPEELVDQQVTVLQARRADESAICTLVAYGCHPVTTGYDMSIYSADYPGPMRDVVRRVSGGECVFFQASGGNVLPRVAFTTDENEAERMGTRLAVEALHAVGDRFATPQQVVALPEGSVTPITVYRLEPEPTEAPTLRATRERVSFPLLPHPTLAELAALSEEFEATLAEAKASGDLGRIKVAFYSAGWARKTMAALREGTAPTSAEGTVHAVRIGDGVIVTGPGETFTEIGMAVKERGPGKPTLYCGYTNGLVTYFATAAEYPFGGYEPGYGNRSVGLPSQVTPESEQILVETGVRLAERLFPEADTWPEERGWTATGALPKLVTEPLRHPSRSPDRTPATDR